MSDLPKIPNQCFRPVNEQTGTTPGVSGGLKDYFQFLTFTPVLKMTAAFQALELGNPQNFWGLVQPFSDRQLLILPEGERAWTWFWLFADPVLTLQVDDVIVFRGKQTRIMTRKDFGIYEYVQYAAIQDWTGSGPS